VTTLTALDQARVWRALTDLAETTPGLAAARITVESHITLAAMLTVEIGVHGEPDVFDAWRAALGIDSDTLERRQLMGGAWVTSGYTISHGIAWALSLYHREPAPTLALAGAA